MEWWALKATPCQRFQGLVPQICVDLGMSEPCAKADVDELYRKETLGGPRLRQARADVQVGRLV
eukprot:6010273-Lingulodinium_polyedra.AAC.1